MQPFHRLKNFVKVLFYALACYVSAAHPMGRCRHYVFELTVHLYVRACVRAMPRHSPTGLPLTSRVHPNSEIFRR